MVEEETVAGCSSSGEDLVEEVAGSVAMSAVVKAAEKKVPEEAVAAEKEEEDKLEEEEEEVAEEEEDKVAIFYSPRRSPSTSLGVLDTLPIPSFHPRHVLPSEGPRRV